MASHLIFPGIKSVAEAYYDAWIAAGLSEQDMYGRYPTIAELESVLSLFKEYKLEYNREVLWSVHITTEDNYNIYMETVSYSGDKHNPHSLRIEGDPDQITKIFRKLPSDCGALLMLTEGEDPIFIKTEG